MERCFWSMKNSLQKKQGAVSHFQSVGVLRPLQINCLQLKAYVKTARMPYAKVRNFLDMERFHDTLVCNFRTLRNEKSSF